MHQRLSINDFPQQPATTMCIGVHIARRMFRKQCLASTTFGAKARNQSAMSGSE